MGATWLGWYVPEREALIAPPGTLEFIVKSFSVLAGPVGAVDATLDERGRSVSLHLNEATADAAFVRLFGDANRTPVWLWIQQYPTSEPWEDDCSQRFCGSCGVLVPTLAVCEACGVAEDGQDWTIGPNKVLFNRSIGLAVCLQGGPDLVRLPLGDLDRRLRRFLDGKLERLEAYLECPLKLVPTIVA